MVSELKKLYSFIDLHFASVFAAFGQDMVDRSR